MIERKKKKRRSSRRIGSGIEGKMKKRGEDTGKMENIMANSHSGRSD